MRFIFTALLAYLHRSGRLSDVCAEDTATFPVPVAADAYLKRVATLLTASSLNYADYAFLDIFISCPSKVTSILRPLWKTKFQGKLTESLY